MADALTAISTRKTPQSEKADPRQVKNNAGGYTFKVGDETRVNRFLTLGTDGGTYYVKESDLTKENAQVILAAARDKGTWLVERLVEISLEGRAPRQNPAIFALAAVAGLGDEEAQKAAHAALPKVCRTGYQLYLYSRYIEQFRGWGPALRRAVGNWYLDKDADQLAYQLIKYRQREGWSHGDLLRLTHPKATTTTHKALFNWVLHRNVETSKAPVTGADREVGATREDLPALIGAFEKAQATTKVADWVGLIADHPMPWEAFPDVALTKAEVWHAMLAKGMPQTALIRQLPRLTNLGVFDNAASLTSAVNALKDPELLRRGRVHPINVLIALRTYAKGRSLMGDNTWTPKRQIVDALDAAFYASFKTYEPSGKRHLLALDVSGSMG